jgi:hypothetical protein
LFVVEINFCEESLSFGELGGAVTGFAPHLHDDQKTYLAVLYCIGVVAFFPAMLQKQVVEGQQVWMELSQPKAQLFSFMSEQILGLLAFSLSKQAFDGRCTQSKRPIAWRATVPEGFIDKELAMLFVGVSLGFEEV